MTLQTDQRTPEHRYRLLHFSLQVSLDAGMKLLIFVCDTKYVEKVHRSLRFTVNETMILSVTISYVKREWVSVVNILTVHPQQRETTVHTMSLEQQSAILAQAAGSLAHHQGQHVLCCQIAQHNCTLLCCQIFMWNIPVYKVCSPVRYFVPRL
jgi:hypothetical protein